MLKICEDILQLAYALSKGQCEYDVLSTGYFCTHSESLIYDGTSFQFEWSTSNGTWVDWRDTKVVLAAAGDDLMVELGVGLLACLEQQGSLSFRCLTQSSGHQWCFARLPAAWAHHQTGCYRDCSQQIPGWCLWHPAWTHGRLPWWILRQSKHSLLN